MACRIPFYVQDPPQPVARPVCLPAVLVHFLLPCLLKFHRGRRSGCCWGARHRPRRSPRPRGTPVCVCGPFGWTAEGRRESERAKTHTHTHDKTGCGVEPSMQPPMQPWMRTRRTISMMVRIMGATPKLTSLPSSISEARPMRVLFYGSHGGGGVGRWRYIRKERKRAGARFVCVSCRSSGTHTKRSDMLGSRRPREASVLMARHRPSRALVCVVGGNGGWK